MSTALILAEAEPVTRGFLERHLADDGFEVHSGDDPLALQATDADLALLGDADALERWRGRCPVIVLGPPGNDDPNERVRAFRRGCDDYLPRPFVYEELLARIHAVLRRSARATHRLVVGGLVVDIRARRVSIDGRPVALATKEFDLLARLASEPHRVFPKDELLRDVWAWESSCRTRTVESHASRIRRKLAAAAGCETTFVVNVWGVGYRLVDSDPPVFTRR